MASFRDREFLYFIDPSPEYENSYSEFTQGGQSFLIVTQRGENDGAQVMLRRSEDGRSWERVDSDTIVDSTVLSAARAAAPPPPGACAASSAADHATVHDLIVAQVGQFSSASGPDHGNLACVWAVRHLVKQALNRAITQTDGTAVFDPELRQCFGAASADEANVPAGGIIISPTTGGVIGHVGLLGPATGGTDRLIYSNSSSAALWKQNFTMAAWIQRYRVTKGLKVHFFPLPNRA
jgi:hypothetical protein